MSKRDKDKANRARRVNAARKRASVERQHRGDHNRGQRGKEARARREQQAREFAKTVAAAWRENCVPAFLRDCIVKLCNANGTIICKDTWINIKAMMCDLPDGDYHYVNDKTRSTQFFSVRGGVPWTTGATMPSGKFVRTVWNKDNSDFHLEF